MSSTNPRSYESIAKPQSHFPGPRVMGYPMAGHLAWRHHSVTVYNRTAAKAVAWCENLPPPGAAQCGYAAAATGADIVLLRRQRRRLAQRSLGSDGALFGGMATRRHLCGIPPRPRPRWRANCMPPRRRWGLQFVDALVSGGQAGAERHADGDAAAKCRRICRRQPVGMAFSRAFTLLGSSGAGQLAKMVNQICIAGPWCRAFETIAFGQNAGLDMKPVLDVIGKGAASKAGRWTTVARPWWTTSSISALPWTGCAGPGAGAG